MEEELTQPATQQVLDPRRLGGDRSGLHQYDVADIICILHPSSNAALDVVKDMAENNPDFVLARDPFDVFDGDTDIDEQETIIVTKSGTPTNDLALRMSAPLCRPYLGFVFGRNAALSDIVFGRDSKKRISNQHFRIYFNDEHVLMLEDMSTNGTMVDDVMLKSKVPGFPKNRMLATGSIISVASVNEAEALKFIVRIPSREGQTDQYYANFKNFIARYIPNEDKRNEALQKIGNKFPYRNDRWSGGETYNFVGQLGKGAFATVYQIATKMDGRLYAAKELEKRKFVKNGQLDKKIDNEMQIMKGLEHPNIVKFIDYHDQGDYLYIIMEFVPHGDLQGHLQLKGALSEPQARTMSRQILDALAYLHRQNITHRDIKPDNILIMREDPFEVKLSDFGLSKVVQDNGTFLKTFCGTLLYCAPEVFPEFDTPNRKQGIKRPRGSNKPRAYGSSVDIWSYAAVLWYSLCREPPFEGIADHTGQAMYNNIMKTVLNPTPLRNHGVSNECIDLLLKMLQTDPSRRPTEHECLRHAWLFDGTLLPGDPVLGSIVEEEEEDGSQEAGQQLSQLQLKDEVAEALNLGPEPEPELDDDDVDFFDPRVSKRIRTDRLFPRNQLRDHDDWSPDASFVSAIVPAGPSAVEESFPPIKPVTPSRPRLFGEITPVALESSLWNAQAHDTLPATGSQPPVQDSQMNGQHSDGRFHTPGRPSHAQGDGVFSSPSLLGAESMVRELNMASPQSHTSGAQTPPGPATPNTPDVPQHSSLEQHSHNSEPTPKAKPSTFNRQISLPKTASFYYDPYDPATHTLEYASKVSGIDFLSQSGAQSSQKANVPDTMRVSVDDEAVTPDEAHAGSPPGATSHSSATSQIQPPPRRLGKLTSTPDSINPNLIMLVDQRTTSFGRLPENTLEWDNKLDTRIPKKAFTIWWASDVAGEVDSYADQGKDFSHLEGLHAGIFTSASGGVSVNGIKLRMTDDEGRFCFGRVHTGDIIQVYHNGKDCLKFRCEFYYGAGKDPRPAGKLFKVERSPKRANILIADAIHVLLR